MHSQAHSRSPRHLFYLLNRLAYVRMITKFLRNFYLKYALNKFICLLFFTTRVYLYGLSVRLDDGLLATLDSRSRHSYTGVLAAINL